MNGGQLEVGHDVWFRVFPGTKHGARWKRGVILGRGENIIAAGGNRIGDQSDRGRTVVPSHHYTIWDSQLQFITSRDRHHIRRAYSDKQRERLLSWLDQIILANKSQSKIRDFFNLNDQNLYTTKYPYSGNQPSENEIGERDINKQYIEEIRESIRKKMEEELKTNLQSRLRFQTQETRSTESSSRTGNTPATPTEPTAPTPDEAWPEEVEGPQDETNLDPDPLPGTWRREVDEHIQETDQWMDNPAPRATSHFIQREMTMEPRRLRSAGMQRPIMLPDVFHRGGPRIQEQTFGIQTSQKEAISILQDTTAISEEEAKKLIGRINPKKPVNVYTMGITASEARAQLLPQRSPAQSNGPSQQQKRTVPTNHPTTTEVRTLTQTENRVRASNKKWARRRRRYTRPRT